jgi:cytochrome P450
MKDNLAKYGDTYCFSLRYNKTNILTVNPEIIQHVLRKNAQNYEKPVAHTDALGEFIGKGLLIATGEYHTRQRRMIQPSFHRKKLSKLVETLDLEIDRFFENLDRQVVDNQKVELNETFRQMTFRLMAKSIFGKSMDLPVIEKFFKNFTTLQDFLNQLVRMPSLLKWYNFTGKTKEYSRLSDENNALIKNAIQSRRKEGGEHDDILDMLINSVYEDTKTGMSDQTLQEESLVLFVAGHETASNILSWIFYLLQQNPIAISKIQLEYQAICGDGKPTFDDLMRMEYLMRVIFEALRIYPPSWITDRIAKEDDEIEGFFIPKGARVIPFIYGLHHSEKLWNNPEVFDPERFTKAQIKERHKFAHMPFGAGPRMCIGRNFALLEMQMVVLKMLERYNFDLVKGQKIELLPAITLKPRNGIWMNLKKKTLSKKATTVATVF